MNLLAKKMTRMTVESKEVFTLNQYGMMRVKKLKIHPRLKIAFVLSVIVWLMTVVHYLGK